MNIKYSVFPSILSLFYYIEKSLAVISVSECQGCSIFSTCDVTFVNNNVYGCGGIWDDDASYLCNDGYEICSSSKRASELGLTRDLCINSIQLEKNKFYMSLQTIDNNENNIFMTNDVYTELLGCAKSNSDSWLYINKKNYNDNSDNVFGAQLSIIDSDDAWKFGWFLDNDEVKHTYSDKSVNGDIMGGVLCCQSSTEGSSNIVDAEKKPTTQSPLLTKEKEKDSSNVLNDDSDDNDSNDDNNDKEEEEEEEDFELTTTTTIIPIETDDDDTISPTSVPTFIPTSAPTRGLSLNKCCHGYHPNRYELRCNLLTAKNICTDSTVARRCYWNSNDCKAGNTTVSSTSASTVCYCTGVGERKQHFCSQYNEKATCMYQNCQWGCT